MTERESHKEYTKLAGVLGIGFIFLLANSAFSLKTRRAIAERDGYKSAVSGKREKLHAAHIDHSKRNPRYDDVSNGRLLTVEEHLQDHINRAGRNGLTIEQNNWAISMLQKLLGSSTG